MNGQSWLDAPYVAHVRYLNAQGTGAQAGGVILSHRHILTSGFATQAIWPVIEVRVGGALRTNQILMTVQGRVVHGQFNQFPRNNDIAILLLTNSLVFNRFIQPIRLPNLESFHPYENEQLTVLGFGGFPGNNNDRSGFLFFYFSDKFQYYFSEN